jgi:hypothetical protein
MVEEIAAAASGLRHQSDDLVETVSVFKLEGQSAYAAAPIRGMRQLSSNQA